LQLGITIAMNEAISTSQASAIRTFICLDIPESIKERIEKLQRELRQMDAQVSWVKPANIHLTLKFLGDVAQTKIPTVSAAVNRPTGSCSPFQVTVGETGCFPSRRNPRVLWIGIAQMPDALRRLHKEIEDELAREGFAREAKKFNPHLTIARLRNPRNAQPLAEALMTRGFEDESFQTSEVIVMRSELSPQGSIYTPQGVIPLNG
jgi:RNA 2',3'-cyclic 3'-phosphodiesterase